MKLYGLQFITDYLQKIKKYEALNLKRPEESQFYYQFSLEALNIIDQIMSEVMNTGRNKIIINTNLTLGIPMENINKIAGPFIEAWAFQTFTEKLDSKDSFLQLVNVEAGERLNMADVVLQFKINTNRQTVKTAHIDVKATSQDIEKSGRSPNIISFGRIRTAYLQDPDYLFVILSIKHKVFSTRNDKTNMMMGVMEVVDFKSYDLKYISDGDLNYNPALGTGQIQIKDIHYVSLNTRSVADFISLLDFKFFKSKKPFDEWLALAHRYLWIK